MDEQAGGRHRAIVVRLTLALGALGILRMIPEVLAVIFWLKESINHRYGRVLFLDAVLGSGALAGGWALRRRSPWGWTAATVAWGAVAVNSAFVSALLVPKVLESPMHGIESMVFLPRIVSCMASELPVPYVFWASLGASRSGSRPKFFPAAALVVSCLASWLATALALEVHPLTLRASWMR